MKTLLTFVILNMGLLISAGPAWAKAADPGTEEAILKFQQEWAKAYVKGDAAALEELLADDFTMTNPEGKVETKADEIRNIKSRALKITECKAEDMKVRVYGKTAVVTGINIIKGVANGQEMSGKYRFTDVLVQKKGKWKAVSAHVTIISDKK